MIWIFGLIQGKKSQEEMKRKVIAHTYGAALPLKMDLDRQILSR